MFAGAALISHRQGSVERRRQEHVVATQLSMTHGAESQLAMLSAPDDAIGQDQSDQASGQTTLAETQLGVPPALYHPSQAVTP